MGFCYSFDEERFDGDFETAEEAAQEAFNYGGLEDGAVSCFVGESDKKMAGDYLSQYDVENLFERMTENASEHCGEACEDWLNFPSQMIVKRNGEEKRVYHAKNLSEEDLAVRQQAWESHDAGVAELTSQIKILINEWADVYGHRPMFWGVKNVVQVSFK